MMNQNEISFWNSKIMLLEMVEKIMSSHLEFGAQPISFCEGLAIYLAQGFIESKAFEQTYYGYLTQRAA
ncbi:MAG: hypothetical protein ACE5HI_09865 [bacterium]